ncbi:Inositol-trisphosphate 3-kinase C [Orchesella cincta]|uniref:Kinase n=1 Tax=Orchesella cincta TaxID=48709 RepID=A0A1D2M1Y9_ORCCI|nr:Inositol-trisphosphate 3-kinase C [Orchesella cincta]
MIAALNALEFTAPSTRLSTRTGEEARANQLCKCPALARLFSCLVTLARSPLRDPNTVWKKMPEDESVCPRTSITPAACASCSAHLVYRRVTSRIPPDPITKIIPKYVTETCYNSQMFLELEDLLTNFQNPNPSIMDIKLGSRTFLESEVKNSKPRPDLYEKLIAVDPTACTDQEHESKAVTKLTYMLFREKQSSSKRVKRENGVYKPENQLNEFQVPESEPAISDVIRRQQRAAPGNNHAARVHPHDPRTIRVFRLPRGDRLKPTLHPRRQTRCVWMIDFAKTFYVEGAKLTHRNEWLMGNREDGVLTGVDNIVRVFQNSSYA